MTLTDGYESPPPMKVSVTLENAGDAGGGRATTEREIASRAMPSPVEAGEPGVPSLQGEENLDACLKLQRVRLRLDKTKEKKKYVAPQPAVAAALRRRRAKMERAPNVVTTSIYWADGAYLFPDSLHR